MHGGTHPSTVLGQDEGSGVVAHGDACQAGNVAGESQNAKRRCGDGTHLSMRKYFAPKAAAFASLVTNEHVPRRMRTT
jgi:hypothetical protein